MGFGLKEFKRLWEKNSHWATSVKDVEGSGGCQNSFLDQNVKKTLKMSAF